MLIDGTWHTDETLSSMQNDKGEFVRAASRFRARLSADGSTGFAPEAGRYHLFLAHSCPWAHRTHIALRVKGLQRMIGVSFAGLPRD